MAMSPETRLKLKIMMFLTYAFNGIWIIPLATYLMHVGYSGDDVGRAYSTFAIGCIISPFFVGMIADKFFPTEKILGILNILSSILLLAAVKYSVGPDGLANRCAEGEVTLGLFYWAILGHFICYMPTWALTNSISFRQMDDPGKEFPRIRVWGTIGWIVVSCVSLLYFYFGDKIDALLNIDAPYEASSLPMYIGVGIGVVTGIFSFFLPHTPPPGKGEKVTFADIIGVKAFALLKDRNFLVFAATSFMILFPGMFYWAFANPYLNESGMNAAATWQSTGQMTEMVFLFIMPWFFARFGVKKMLMIGLFAWILRFICFSFGVWGTATAALVVLGLMLHGPCFDFFFVTGQLYTNKKAPGDIQSQAQGFIFLITFGLGWFLGSKVAGRIVEKFAIKELVEGAEKTVGHNWHEIWLWPIAFVAFIIVFFALGFHDKTKVGHSDESA